MSKQSFKTALRYFLHKVLRGEFRQQIYTIPYAFFIKRFMRNVDVDHMPMFSYIEIETINRCNGKCSFCPVNVNQPQRPYAKMSDELYRKIIDELSDADYSGEIHLFSNNEPLLDDRIFEFAAYARKKVPKSYINLFTNGSLLTVEKATELCKSIDLLVVDNYSEDGKTPEKLGVVQRYFENHSELRNKIVFDIKNPESVLSSRGGQAPNKAKTSLFGVKGGCIYPYRQMVVRPDGKCSLCCNDALGKYTLGDVSVNTLREIWYSEEYRKIRINMKNYGREKMMLCNSCDTHYFDKT